MTRNNGSEKGPALPNPLYWNWLGPVLAEEAFLYKTWLFFLKFNIFIFHQLLSISAGLCVCVCVCVCALFVICWAIEKTGLFFFRCCVYGNSVLIFPAAAQNSKGIQIAGGATNINNLNIFIIFHI